MKKKQKKQVLSLLHVINKHIGKVTIDFYSPVTHPST